MYICMRSGGVRSLGRGEDGGSDGLGGFMGWLW